MNPNEEHEEHRWENEGGPAVLDPAEDPDDDLWEQEDDEDFDDDEWDGWDDEDEDY